MNRPAVPKVTFARSFVLFSFVLFFAIFLSGVAAPVFSQTAEVKAILKAIDEMNDFTGRDFTGVFTIVSDKPNEKQSAQQIRMFRRDDKEQFLILIMLPEASKGQGYMKEGDNVWFYDPGSRKFSHTSLKENLNDSEAKSGDFTKRSLLDDYDTTLVEDGNVGKVPVRVITLKAKTNEVSYDIIKLYVRKDRPLVLKQEDFGLSGRLMRTTLFPKYADIGSGKFYPSQMLVVDEINKGEKSQITMTDLSTARQPDVVFTKAFLEQVN